MIPVASRTVGDHAAGPMYSFPPCYHVFSVHESAVPVLGWLMERLSDTLNFG